MKTCISCGNILSDGAAYCHLCNTSQTSGFNEFEAAPKYDDTFLKILCGFTIAGAVLHFISLPFSWKSMAAMPNTDPNIILGLNTIVVLGKLAGAIFMLRKKLYGLHIYTGASLMGILSTLVLTMKLTQFLNGAFSAFISFAAIFFPIVFLILYWLPANRRVLS
jgi:hypothetical protein